MKGNSKLFSTLKKLFIIVLMLLITFGGYVAIITRNTMHMTIRQRVLKSIYPAFTWWNRLVRTQSKVFVNELPAPPPQSLYDLSVTLNNGESVSLSAYKGKKILLVNTASNCGFTDQYESLQQLYLAHKEKLTIIGFPANDFKEQEQGTDEEIARFCKMNYGVSFPLVKKCVVKAGPDQHPVFKWLTDKTKNGWTSKKPSWNFSKYLVNESGILINYFDPSVSPTGKEITQAINR